MLTLTQRLPATPDAAVKFTMLLTADERRKSRHRYLAPDGEAVYLRLPRGTVLRDRDLLLSEDGDIAVGVQAKPEPVLTVTANTPLALLKAAYHLGNRHVPLEITTTYLRLSPDDVLKNMLLMMQMEVKEEVVPFQPELGAYGHHH
jgi:urease accessory protein